MFATAGSPEKCAACERLGAERAVNYKTEDFVAIIKSLTGGKGVDVILDMVAGDYVQREFSALADDGRLSIIAFLGGSKANLDLNDVLRRRLTVTGSTLRPRSVEFKTSIAVALREKVWPSIESGKIRPVIYRTFALEEASQAHALMESGAHIGKIMLDVEGRPPHDRYYIDAEAGSRSDTAAVPRPDRRICWKAIAGGGVRRRNR